MAKINWDLYMTLLEEWEEKNKIIDSNEDHEKAILYCLQRVYEMAKNNELD